MTPRTQKYLSISRAVEAYFFVEVDAYDQESGATKKIRAIYKSRAKQISSQWYFDILHPRTGIRPIVSNVAPQGGIGFQGNVSIQMSAPVGLDRYSYIGQRMNIYLHIPHTGDTDQIFWGTVQSTQSLSRGIVLNAAENTQNTFPDTPTKRITFSDFPNAPLSNIGLRVPVVFGEMDTPPTLPTLPSTAYLAPAVCTDAIQLEFMATDIQSDTYGTLYVWDVGLNAFAPIPHTQNGKIAQVSRAPTIELDAPLSPTADASASVLPSSLTPRRSMDPADAYARQDPVVIEGLLLTVPESPQR